MKIWLINQYNMPPEYGHLNRHFNFGKYMKRLGHEPTVFVGSFLHNTKIQMIEDNSVIRRYENSEYPYYFIKTCDYSSSKLKRIYAMYEFYRNLLKSVKLFDKPDVILGSSAHPLAAVAAIKLAKKYGCQSIVEVRDLWPESFVAYGIISKKNPLLKLLYSGEKWIYRNADKLVFTMEGGKDYIIEQSWDADQGGPIDINKVYHINNGVDLEVFNYNKENYQFEDKDISDSEVIKIIYTGSIRKVNNLNILLDTAKIIKRNDVKFLVYGDGDERKNLEERCKTENINNVIFKGKIDKKYIPFILSKADINFMHGGHSPIMRYGMSANKLFDYIASKKIIVSDMKSNYDIILSYGIGEVASEAKPEIIAEIITEVIDELYYNRTIEKFEQACFDYDFKNLTQKLINVIEHCDS